MTKSSFIFLPVLIPLSPKSHRVPSRVKEIRFSYRKGTDERNGLEHSQS